MKIISLKQSLMAFLIQVSFFGPFIAAMESIIQGVPEQETSENKVEELTQAEVVEQFLAQKKKKKNKKKKNEKTIVSDKIETSVQKPTTEKFYSFEEIKKDIDSIIKNENGAEENLRRLQWLTNLILLHVQHLEGLKELTDVIGQMNETQEYRYKNNKFCDQIWLINGSNDFANETAALLQLIKISKKHIHSNNEFDLANKFLKHDNDKLKAIGGFTKHLMLSWKVLPILLYFFNYSTLITMKYHYELGSLEKFLMDRRIFEKGACNIAVCQTIKKFPYFEELIHCTMQIVNCIWNSMEEENETHILISKDMLDKRQGIITLLDKIEQYKSFYEEIYQYILKRMKDIRKSNSKNKPQLLEFFKRFSTFFHLKTSAKNLEKSTEEMINLFGFIEESLPQSIFCDPADEPIKNVKKGSNQKKNKPTKQKNKSKKNTKASLSSKMASLNISAEKEEESKNNDESSFNSIEEPSSAIYDPRVLRWLDTNFIQDKSYEAIEYHSFSFIVDPYLFSHGIVTDRFNNMLHTSDKVYQLGGEITLANGDRRLVVFHATKNSNGVCYHRGIENKQKNSLFEEYFANNYWEVFHRDEFPALGPIEKPFEMSQSSEKASVESEDDLCVKINDPRLNIKITLFKPAITH